MCVKTNIFRGWCILYSRTKNPFPKAEFTLVWRYFKLKVKSPSLLSSAGLGKTVELNYLASYYSAQDQIAFPIRVVLSLYTGEEIEDLLQKECPGWAQVPPDLLVLIFDGLG